MTEQKNHGCRHSWCINTAANGEAQLNEHLSPAHWIPATGDSLGDYGTSAMDQAVKTVGVGVRYNADQDPAPTLYLNLGSRAEAHLQLNEAMLLCAALRQQLTALEADLQIQLEQIESYLGEGR